MLPGILKFASTYNCPIVVDLENKDCTDQEKQFMEKTFTQEVRKLVVLVNIRTKVNTTILTSSDSTNGGSISKSIGETERFKYWMDLGFKVVLPIFPYFRAGIPVSIIA
jgi:hypothetical protein